MKRGIAKCVHCGAQIPSGANYCHHCGRRTRGLHTALKLCPHCKKQVDGVSTYCKHCGRSLSGKKPASPLSFMMHILVFLIILLALFLLYTYPRPLQEVPEELPASASVSLRDLTCTPTARGFDLCGNIAFEGGSYAKAHIPGGEELDAAEKHYESFTYCQSIGSEEGMRVLRAFVYDEHDNLITDRGEGVSCDRPDVTPFVQASPYAYEKFVQLYTENQFDRPEGQGQMVVQFPDPVLSCVITGDFDIDDGARKTGTKTTGTQQYCDGAHGSFSGQLTFAQQHTLVDADPFLWDSVALIDPEPTAYADYIAYARTCDTQYRIKERYYTSVRTRGVGTDTLILDWYYKNDDTHPRVFFNFDFACQLRSS